MYDANVAITSAGITWWKLVSVNVPALIIPALKREIEIAKVLHHNRLAYQIVTYDQLSKLAKITHKIEKCLKDGLQELSDTERFENLLNPNV